MSKHIININGEDVNVASRGIAQARRLALASSFINTYGRQAIRDIDFEGMDEKDTVKMVDILISFMGSLDEEALIMLGEIVSGRDTEFVEENFDLDWVIEGLSWMVNEGPFHKLIQRFFGSAEQ